MPVVFHAGAMRVANNLRPKRRRTKTDRDASVRRPAESSISGRFDDIKSPEKIGARDSRSSILNGTTDGWPIRLVQHRGFVVSVNLAIMASAVQMGIQAELGSAADDIVALRVLENLFTALFTLEMLLKLYVQGCRYFMDAWNVLDFVVASVSIIYTWLMPSIGFSGGSNLSVIKAFRLLRLLRLIKLTNSIPTLRMVVEGLIGSLRALFWVVMLLMLILYLFAIICVEVIGSSPLGTYPGYSSETGDIVSSISFVNFNNFEYFGTVSRSMATLFSMSILAEWDSFRPVWEFQPFCTPIIASLIFCTTFGIVNVIIGVIVEHTTNSMNEIKLDEEQEEKQLRMDHIRTVATDLWKSDHDGDGNISREEMRTAGRDSKFAEHFRKTDLPKGFTFDDLYDMCNLQGKDGLSEYDFMAGMQRMIFGSEFQKTCLVMLGMGQIKQLHQQMVKEQTGYLEVQFESLRKDIHAIAAEVHSFRTVSGSVPGPPPPPSCVETNGKNPPKLRPELIFDASSLAYRAPEEARCQSRGSNEVMSMPVAESAVPPEDHSNGSEHIPAESESHIGAAVPPLSPRIVAMAEQILAESNIGVVVPHGMSELSFGVALEPGGSQRNSRKGVGLEQGSPPKSSRDVGGSSPRALGCLVSSLEALKDVKSNKP